MANDEDVRQWTLEPMQEFRFEVDSKNKIKIKITSGKAEIFGTEVATDVEYHFTAKKLAIFSWHGCKLESSGANIVEYIGKETPMNSIINVHFALQKIRQDAATAGTNGPRVMIVGPSDVGKTAVAKILASYAARSASFPILCEIDPAGGLISLPESISAMVIHRPIDPEEEFNASISLYKTSPITFYYGSSDITDKKKVFTSILSKLASKVSLKLEDPALKSAGIIIDTPSQFMEQGGFSILTSAIDEFKVNVILVIGNERLLSDLEKTYPDRTTMSIIKLDKSGGVVSRNKEERRKVHLQRIKDYFYGTLKNDLTPFSQTVSFTDIIVRRAMEGSIAPSSTLPIGMEANPNEIKFVKVESGDILLHSVLAVSYTPLAGSVDPKDPTAAPKIYTPEEEAEALLTTNICGFVYVSEVDDNKRKMTILAPNPGRLPKTFYIVGALKWLDG